MRVITLLRMFHTDCKDSSLWILSRLWIPILALYLEYSVPSSFFLKTNLESQMFLLIVLEIFLVCRPLQLLCFLWTIRFDFRTLYRLLGSTLNNLCLCIQLAQFYLTVCRTPCIRIILKWFMYTFASALIVSISDSQSEVLTGFMLYRYTADLKERWSHYVI